MIVVIGAAGQLGRDICQLLGPGNVLPLTHQDVELRDQESLMRALRPVAPRVVINTAAYNHVDDAELKPLDAFQTNAIGSLELARVCRDLDATLVYFSTDYVFGFDASRDHPYTESDLPGPISVYGLSKLAGEHFVRSNCSNSLVIRTCGLYGLHGQGGKGRNFVQTMVRLGREKGAVRVVNDQICTPTFTMDLAEAAVLLIRANARGLYHWTNRGQCSWFEFACEIFRQLGMQVRCEAITSDQFGARAKRPGYSVLSTGLYERMGFAAPRPWHQALSEYLTKWRSVHAVE